jgi:spermidine synthase
VLLAAGLLVLLVPAMRPVVLRAAQPLGLRTGALASAFVLFGPALFLLGCVSPWVIRLAAREVARLGRTVGTYYAASTAGSVAGTILTGFFLIAWIGVDRIFWLCGGLLVLLAAIWFVVFRGRWLAAVALLAPALTMPQPTLPVATMPRGTEARVVHKRDSFYGNLRVVEYRHGPMGTRELVIDGLVQGGVDQSSGMSVYEYPYLLEFLPYALHPEGRRCLVVGLGAGVVPRWYRARGVATEVVDIDPDVVALARRYFAFGDDIPVHVEDARTFLARGKDRYDYVILDVFNGDTTPGHLLSAQAIRQAKARLAPNGIFAANLLGSVGSDAEMTHSVLRTLATVFDTVTTYAGFVPDTPDAIGNLVVLAYDGPARMPDPGRWQAFPVHPLARENVEASLRGPVRLPVTQTAMVLTDDFNPLDLRDLAAKERVRRGILETTHPDILLR